VALEVVGVEAALHLGMQIVRPWGVVSSCGIHTHDVNMKGLDLYNKVRLARCCRQRTKAEQLYSPEPALSVRPLPRARPLPRGAQAARAECPAVSLSLQQHPLPLLCRADTRISFESFVQNTVSVDEAPKYYELFEKQKVRRAACPSAACSVADAQDDRHKCLKTVFTFDS
jgi:hypothetical protein